MKERRLLRIACSLASAVMIFSAVQTGCLPKDDPKESGTMNAVSDPSAFVSESSESIETKTERHIVTYESEPDPVTTASSTTPTATEPSVATTPSEPSTSTTTSNPMETTDPSVDPSSIPTLPSLPTELEVPLQQIFEMIVPSVLSIRVVIPKTQLYEQREELFSGLMVEPVGTVVTTYSLLEPALDYRGNLIRGTSISICVPSYPKAFEATLIGVHPITDLALLRITNPDGILFEAAPLSKEYLSIVGSTVYSVGYPSDLIARGGLSVGYVTSVYKTIYQEDGSPVGLLETDIPTLQHYAGGPLLNTQGEVVGITTGYLKRVYYQNQGYAVPSPVVLDVIRQINARVNRMPDEPQKASFGIVVMGDEDYDKIRERMDYPDGLYIARVKSESPAYTAGLSNGDILLSLNNQRMVSLNDLILFMESQIVGGHVEIKAYRPSEKRTLTLSCYLREEQP
ncbi:MAG: serine protease [Clostridiaceae bacterium]|jgi:serine protease Do|nr:serine protease [Clostridiaceae bacterium]